MFIALSKIYVHPLPSGLYNGSHLYPKIHLSALNCQLKLILLWQWFMYSSSLNWIRKRFYTRKLLNFETLKWRVMIILHKITASPHLIHIKHSNPFWPLIWGWNASWLVLQEKRTKFVFTTSLYPLRLLTPRKPGLKGVLWRDLLKVRAVPNKCSPNSVW